MSVLPITEAIPIVRASVDTALRPLVAAVQGGTNGARLYWLRQSLNTYPCVIHQSQDAGGQAEPFLLENGWTGLWAIRALATDPDTADTWLAAIISGMNSLSATGYRIYATHSRPLSIPPEENIWQAAQLYRIYLFHTA